MLCLGDPLVPPWCLNTYWFKSLKLKDILCESAVRHKDILCESAVRHKNILCEKCTEAQRYIM